jgi:hypothetical protein
LSKQYPCTPDKPTIEELTALWNTEKKTAPRVSLALLDALQDDDDHHADFTALRCYLRATPEQREAINEMLICLCGWSFPTLVSKAEASEDEDDNEDDEDEDDDDDEEDR